MYTLPAEPEGEGVSAEGPSSGTVAVWWWPVDRNLPTQGWRRGGPRSLGSKPALLFLPESFGPQGDQEDSQNNVWCPGGTQ